MADGVSQTEPPSKKSISNKSWLSRLFSSDNKHNVEDALNIDTIKTSVEQAVMEGSLETDTSLMINGVLNVSEATAKDIMVPRAKMQILKIDWPFERILKIIIESGHSRFPVIGEDEEELKGILLSKDLLPFFSQQNVALEPLLRPAQFVPEGKGVMALLRDFRVTHSHLAIVVNEYGDMSGLVTIEDVLELIVGNINDEHDKEEEIQIKKLREHEFLVNALVSIEHFNEHFDTHFHNEEVDTIGGILLTHLGCLPKNNEEIIIDNLCFKVLPFDGKRLNLLEVKYLTQIEE